MVLLLLLDVVLDDVKFLLFFLLFSLLLFLFLVVFFGVFVTEVLLCNINADNATNNNVAIYLTFSVQIDLRGHCNPAFICFPMFIYIMLYFLIIYLDLLYSLSSHIVNKHTYIQSICMYVY